VYPAERDTGDASEVGGKLRADIEKLPHPLRPSDADVQHVFRVEMQDLTTASERGAANHRPRGGQAVFGLQIAETFSERAAEKITHALHSLIVVGQDTWDKRAGLVDGYGIPKHM
jgi:hypothetical protein